MAMGERGAESLLPQKEKGRKRGGTLHHPLARKKKENRKEHSFRPRSKKRSGGELGEKWKLQTRRGKKKKPGVDQPGKKQPVPPGPGEKKRRRWPLGQDRGKKRGKKTSRLKKKKKRRTKKKKKNKRKKKNTETAQ